MLVPPSDVDHLRADDFTVDEGYSNEVRKGYNALFGNKACKQVLSELKELLETLNDLIETLKNDGDKKPNKDIGRLK